MILRSSREIRLHRVPTRQAPQRGDLRPEAVPFRPPDGGDLQQVRVSCPQIMSTDLNGLICKTITQVTQTRLPPVERAAHWP